MCNQRNNNSYEEKLKNKNRQVMLINENSFEFNRTIGRNFLFNNDTHLTFAPCEDTSNRPRFEDSLRLTNGMDSFVSNLFGPNHSSATEGINMER